MVSDWNGHVARDLAQTDAAGVGGAKFRPGRICNCSSHNEKLIANFYSKTVNIEHVQRERYWIAFVVPAVQHA
jgi:hypothetical protein